MSTTAELSPQMDMGTDTSKPPGGPLGENIVYWRLPESEGGQVIVNNAWETMNGNDLRDHLTDF